MEGMHILFQMAYIFAGNEVIKMYQSKVLSSSSISDVCGSTNCQ